MQPVQKYSAFHIHNQYPSIKVMLHNESANQSIQATKCVSHDTELHFPAWLSFWNFIPIGSAPGSALHSSSSSFISSTQNERARFLLQITAITFLGYLKYKILERQTKVTQRSKHALSCHAFRSVKSTKCS